MRERGQAMEESFCVFGFKVIATKTEVREKEM